MVWNFLSSEEWVLVGRWHASTARKCLGGIGILDLTIVWVFCEQ